MKWEPWERYKSVEIVELKDITEPPCKNCTYFNPRIKTNEYGEPDGVVICTTRDEMHHDFSCYRERPKWDVERCM